MRNYDEMLSAILHAVPRTEELESLTEEQKQTLKGATNCIANVIYLSTPEGKQFIEESKTRRAAKAADAA